jgi:hypothetical protein
MKLNSYLKNNGESSWLFKLGFRFEFSLNFFEVFTSIHRLFSILSLRWWFKVQTRGFFWIYLDLVEIRTKIFEKISDPSSSHFLRPCDRVNPLDLHLNCRDQFDDEGSREEPLRTSKKIQFEVNFAAWLLDWNLCDEIDENLWWFGVDFVLVWYEFGYSGQLGFEDDELVHHCSWAFLGFLRVLIEMFGREKVKMCLCWVVKICVAWQWLGAFYRLPSVLLDQ